MQVRKRQKFFSTFGKVELLSPCVLGCPAGIEIPACLGKLRDEKFEEALEIIMEKNPFPSITGRICPHSCEEQCNRKEYDASVSIKAVERFVGDYGLKKRMKVNLSKKTDKSVVIVGSGPAGLSAAYFLKKAGHHTVIFEKEKRPGGMLRYSIPPYRLPREILNEIISMVEKMGIEIRTSMELGKSLKLDELKKNFDAVLLALGSWKEKDIGIKGEKFLIPSLEFLKGVNCGLVKIVGKNIAVIGGGNAAVDSARTLTKLGKKVTLIYRRGEGEMPAVKEEVEKAKEEGVEFMFLTQATQAVEDGKKITLKCAKTTLGQVDATGRKAPIPVAGSEFEVQFDDVIKAIGQTPDISPIDEKFLDDHNEIRADVSTGRIKDEFFSAGDFLWGSSTTVIEAIAMGRKVAKSIDCYLRDNKVISEAPPDKEQVVVFEQLDIDTLKELRINAYRHIDKASTPSISLPERINSMGEEASSIGMEEVRREAERCFSCGYCRLCEMCVH
ncbi:FAD-dependent oxidoreductase [Candidatus Aerophobetes bacterium]|uniref:FAD-dependent oxidoreductase n=1 Tax=Aerophobetes bacterium TaxID=2030807 RepID=A0A523RRR2_UNCAE|nr:MAG: FAD-dependent oxidoreductase [Candidatus Aerophobetes bacterium]